MHMPLLYPLPLFLCIRSATAQCSVCWPESRVLTVMLSVMLSVMVSVMLSVATNVMYVLGMWAFGGDIAFPHSLSNGPLSRLKYCLNEYSPI